MCSKMPCQNRTSGDTCDSGVGVNDSAPGGKIGVRSGRGVRAGGRGVMVGVAQMKAGGVGMVAGSSKPPPARPTATSSTTTWVAANVGVGTGVSSNVPAPPGEAGGAVTSGVCVVTMGVSGRGKSGAGNVGIAAVGGVTTYGSSPVGTRVGQGVGADGAEAGVAVGGLMTTLSGGT